MASTAVAAPAEDRRPLYVSQLEHVVRELDAQVTVRITAEHPEDHGLEPWVAALVVQLREEASDGND